MQSNQKVQGVTVTDRFEKIVSRISEVILGKKEQIRLALTCLFAGGHLLIEDIPGIGKTTMAKVIARSMGLDFKRIQCTSDMLPGDILGVSIFEKTSQTFVFHPGPIFTQVLLADEINRAPPKTQSALLEAMEEGQVTIDGVTRSLDSPFFVIATQNPLEQWGTFPLPESQMDRFLMCISLGYPARSAEKELLAGGDAKRKAEKMDPLISKEELLLIQRQVEEVHASPAILDYIQDILEFSRNSGEFATGLSPRAGLLLLKAAKSWAYLNGREYVLPEDIKEVLPRVTGHRLKSKKTLAALSPGSLVSLFNQVPVD